MTKTPLVTEEEIHQMMLGCENHPQLCNRVQAVASLAAKRALEEAAKWHDECADGANRAAEVLLKNYAPESKNECLSESNRYLIRMNAHEESAKHLRSLADRKPE
jgi:hypothetical protein